MDPLSIATGVVGFVGFSLHTARRVKDFIDGIEGAPRAVKALSSDVYALYDVLLEFSNTLNDPGFRETFARSNFLVTLQRPLENCANSLEDVTTLIKPFTKPTGDPKVSKWRSVAWTFKEREIEVLRSQLMAYKSSLDVALSVASISATNEARQDINRNIRGLRRHIDLDEDSVQHPTYVGSEAIGTDQGYALRRYLMDTQTEMGTVNERGPPPQSVGFVSRRTSNILPEWQSRLPQETTSAAKKLKGTMADYLQKLTARNTRVNTPMQSLQGVQQLLNEQPAYELPAAPASPMVLSSPYRAELDSTPLASYIPPAPPSPAVSAISAETNSPPALVIPYLVAPVPVPVPVSEPEPDLNHTSLENPLELDSVPIDMQQKDALISQLSVWKLPKKPVFGHPLEQLYKRDGDVVPLLVQKCVGALRRFAAGRTNIYSDSAIEIGTSSVKVLTNHFNHDASQVRLESPADFGYDICSVAAVLKHFLFQLPEPLLVRQKSDAIPSKEDNDLLPIILMVQNLNMCAQETVKDVVMLLHDTWTLTLQRSPALANRQLQDLASTFARMFAGLGDPIPGHWMKILIQQATLIFGYTSAGYLHSETSSLQMYLNRLPLKGPPVAEPEKDDNSKSKSPEETSEIVISACITDVADDLWVMQAYNPPLKAGVSSDTEISRISAADIQEISVPSATEGLGRFSWTFDRWDAW